MVGILDAHEANNNPDKKKNDFKNSFLFQPKYIGPVFQTPQDLQKCQLLPNIADKKLAFFDIFWQMGNVLPGFTFS